MTKDSLRLVGLLGVVAISFVVTLLATPLCRRLALILGAVDRPDGDLKRHVSSTPYLGGVAIFLGWAAGMAVAPPLSYGILLGGLGIMLLGLRDDMRPMSPWVKLIGIAAIGSVVFFVEASPWTLVLAIPLTVTITVTTCTATNLIDGMDGLSAAVTGTAAMGLCAVAWSLQPVNAHDRWIEQSIVLSLATAGASFGFLLHNRRPARIFMGDAGSLLLGWSVAGILLLLVRQATSRGLLAGVTVFGLPFVALMLTMWQRRREGHPILQGDRRHFYEQWLDRGKSVSQIVMTSCALGALLALCGVGSIYLPVRYAVVLCAGVLAVVGWLIYDAPRST